MNILVFNCGSSSLTFKVYEHSRDELAELVVGKARRVGVTGDKPSTLEFHFRGQESMEQLPLRNHRTAAIRIIEGLERLGVGVDMIGHRFPNGMDYFATAEITPALMPTLRSLVPLIPIHHSIALAVINECLKRFPDKKQYVTTDNAFHRGLPTRASSYVLGKDVLEKFRFRRIGFHGLSFQYVAERAPALTGVAADKLRMVICHLGTGGSEINAVAGGRSMDVSMGYTGLPGVVMSTRCGDVDSLLPLYLMQAHGYGVDDIQDLLNNKSGLLGLSGRSSDIRDLLSRREQGEAAARLAVDVYVRGVKRFIGSFVSALGGVDCLVFTDDVGVQCPEIRELSCSGLGFFGIELDVEKNRLPVPEEGLFVHSAQSRVKVLVMHTDEELVMAEAGIRLFEGESA